MQIMKVTYFIKYIQIAVEGCSKNKIAILKSTALTSLLAQLNGENPPRSETRLYITMSKMSSHTEHDFSRFMKTGKTVDHNLINRIEDLVREGITFVHEVKTCLRYYRQDVLFSGKETPDSGWRAFYPTSKDVSNHIQEALRKGRCNNLDQENVIQLTDALQVEENTSRVSFRPYCCSGEETAARASESDKQQPDMEETLAKECDKTSFLLPVTLHRRATYAVWKQCDMS